MELRRLRSRTASFANAWAGWQAAFKTQPNFVFHLAAALGVIITGWRLSLESWEWVAAILAIALVLTAELVNSAVEAATDGLKAHKKTEADDRYIQLAKDLAAGAVLAAAAFAAAAGLIVFLPHLFK